MSQPVAGPAAVISVHGIRTRGAWQKQLVPFLNRAGFHAYPIDYGFFWAIALLVPFARRRKVDWFMNEFNRLTAEYESCHVIAHSFGTYIIARAMEIYPELRCDRLILCGSIVRRDYPWDDLRERRQVTRVLNDYGRLDVWSRIAEWVVSDAGQSGLRGFDLATSSGAVVQREHPEFRHSDYFYDRNYKDNWIPFLSGHEPPATLPRPAKRTNWRFVATIVLVVVLLGFGMFGWSHLNNVFTTGKPAVSPAPEWRGVQTTATETADTSDSSRLSPAPAASQVSHERGVPDAPRGGPAEVVGHLRITPRRRVPVLETNDITTPGFRCASPHGEGTNVVPINITPAPGWTVDINTIRYHSTWSDHASFTMNTASPTGFSATLTCSGWGRITGPFGVVLDAGSVGVEQGYFTYTESRPTTRLEDGAAIQRTLHRGETLSIRGLPDDSETVQVELTRPTGEKVLLEGAGANSFLRAQFDSGSKILTVSAR